MSTPTPAPTFSVRYWDGAASEPPLQVAPFLQRFGYKPTPGWYVVETTDTEHPVFWWGPYPTIEDAADAQQCIKASRDPERLRAETRSDPGTAPETPWLNDPPEPELLAPELPIFAPKIAENGPK